MEKFLLLLFVPTLWLSKNYNIIYFLSLILTPGIKDHRHDGLMYAGYLS